MLKIYHNPECGTSRNTLALIRHAGLEPQIIEYLVTPPTRAELIEMIGKSGLSVRAAMRQNVEPFETLKLAEEHWTDAQLLEFMVAHPILINRPFVVTDLGAKLCRPSELVLDLLPEQDLTAFYKEDGEQVIDQNGNKTVKK